ncbi:MAG: EAL domain-containing protein [Gallionellaceae bacterium]
MNISKPIWTIPCLILVLGLCATYFLQLYVQDKERRIRQEEFAFNIHELRHSVEQRLAAYEYVLHGGRALFVSSHSVSRDEFHSYVNALDLDSHYPGIQGVGFAMLIPQGEMNRHIALQRKQGFPDYTPYPQGTRALYTSIIYLEPFDIRNQRALGYDMFSEPVRRLAMERARDLDESAMSGKVTLVQEIDKQVQAGFLIYMPVYRNDRPHLTLAERRANIIGWVYSPFRMGNLMSGILGRKAKHIAFEIYDGETQTTDSLMYASSDAPIESSKNTLSSSGKIEFAGQSWTFQVRSLHGSNAGYVRTIQLSGVLVSVLLALLAWLLVSGRDRAFRLAQDMTKELRASEERFRKLVKVVPISLGILSEAGVIQDFNDRFAQTFGYSHDDIPTFDAWCLLAYPEENYRKWAITTWNEAVQAAAETGHDILRPVEHQVTCKNGEVRIIQISGVKLDSDFLATFIDLTEHNHIENELKQIKERYDFATMVGKVGTWDWSPVTGELIWSDETFRLMGYAPGSITPTYELFLGQVHTDDAERLNHDVQAALNDKKPYALDCQISLADDKTLTCNVTGKVEFDENDQPIRMLGTIQDVTERKLAEQALQESEEKYRCLFDYSEDPMWLILDDHFVMTNRASAQLLGYETASALTDIHPSELSPEFQSDGQRSYDKANTMMSAAYREGYHRFEWLHKKKDDEVFPVEVSLTRIPYEGREALFCIWRDISERKQAEENLAKLSLAVEQSPNSIMITDLDARVEYVNKTFIQVSGYSAEEVLGKNPRILQSGKTPQKDYDNMWEMLSHGEAWSGELINQRKDGSEYTEEVTISPVRHRDGQVINYLAVKTDVTQKKKDDERIERLAHFDQLTGLPNRILMLDHFKFALSLAQRSEESLTVMFIDLDHFKDINDSLGHRIGDQLLMEVGRRLKTSLREQDTVSRQGGDEFILILPGTDADGAALAASKLLAEIAQPCFIEQHELIVTPSIGIAIYPDDGGDWEVLSKSADAAMYNVKLLSRNDFRFYTSEMQALSSRTLQLSNALRHALQRKELQLHYQPQISVQDGHVVGVEALLRWQHPELGMISPAEFIPIAEDNGQIIPIGEWVLRTASQQLKDWIAMGLPPMTMAVNLSAVQFRQPGICDVIMGIIDEVQLPHEYLELELTEAVAMDDPLAAIEVMNTLHSNGIRMSIDDFGTGYSSLSYLKKFKVYKLKIDQSFVRDITDDPDDKAIVATIINLASSLGMCTIAEGVETAGQLAFLRLQGCDEVQGYYFSKPLTAERLEKFVREMMQSSST